MVVLVHGSTLFAASTIFVAAVTIFALKLFQARITIFKLRDKKLVGFSPHSLAYPRQAEFAEICEANAAMESNTRTSLFLLQDYIPASKRRSS